MRCAASAAMSAVTACFFESTYKDASILGSTVGAACMTDAKPGCRLAQPSHTARAVSRASARRATGRVPYAMPYRPRAPASGAWPCQPPQIARQRVAPRRMLRLAPACRPSSCREGSRPARGAQPRATRHAAHPARARSTPAPRRASAHAAHTKPPRHAAAVPLKDPRRALCSARAALGRSGRSRGEASARATRACEQTRM